MDVAAVISDRVFEIAGVEELPSPGMAVDLRGRAAPLNVRVLAGEWSGAAEAFQARPDVEE